MRDRRRFIAVSLLGCLLSFTAAPTTASAGPLLDWLFQRNRSQSLTRTANYPTATRTGFGSCLDGSCLFGRGRNALASRGAGPATGLAARHDLNTTTAGYAPQGSCGPGWCQQTVVRYVPQIAYRTAYQPVPVTTYKTSTTINPENGLPRTCTRPCTSYTYQARRVPYTTYRPVYTTVPVADTLGQTTAGFAPQSPPAASIAPSLAPQSGRFTAPSTYAYQPPSACSCQTAGSTYSGSYSQYDSRIPGYTPGNATSFPPNPASGSWSNGADQSYDTPGATPWRSANDRGYGASPGSPSGATPWQRDDGYSSSPSGYGSGSGSQTGGLGGSGGTAADTRPSLRPEYSSDYSNQTSDGYAPTTRLKPVPMPESIRRRFEEKPRRTTDPIDEDAQAGARDLRDRSGRDYASRDDDLFLTPNRSAQINLKQAPLLDPPSNQSSFDLSEDQEPHYDSRAIRDVDPDSQGGESSRGVELNDKTAMAKATRRLSPRGTRPVHQSERVSTSRYASVPIQWPTKSRVNQFSPPNRQSARWRSN